MSNSDDETRFIEEMEQRAEEEGHSQMFECPGQPNEDCGSHEFGVSLLARVGKSDAIGVYCAECGWPVIDADINNAADGIRAQIREMHGDE